MNTGHAAPSLHAPRDPLNSPSPKDPRHALREQVALEAENGADRSFGLALDSLARPPRLGHALALDMAHTVVALPIPGQGLSFAPRLHAHHVGANA